MIDKTVDGILGVKFVYKETDSDFVVFSCYLPPENSTRGRDAQTFFAHLLAQMYLQCDCDNMIILGDFNARIGPMSDTVYDCDSIPERTIIDKSINQHGHEFIEFLTESKCCVLNGRFDNCDDNFTRGKLLWITFVYRMTRLTNISISRLLRFSRLWMRILYTDY